MGRSIEKRPGSCYCLRVGFFRHALDALYDRQGTVVMGVLNVTPDSFFDGGRFMGEAGLHRFDELVDEGADIVDIGGESTRPGAPPVSADEQIQRIGPVLKHAVARHEVLVTVDTTNVEVAEFALKSGAHAINDVSCLSDRQIAKVVAAFGASLIVMHARGPMVSMPGFSEVPEHSYVDLVSEVKREWAAARDSAIAEGMRREDVLFDPGIGFWKSARHSLNLLRNIAEFRDLQAPVVIGASRKSFLTLIDSTPPELRLGGSIAACLYAAQNGTHAVRVHDVRATRQALSLARMLNGTIRTPGNFDERSLGGAC